MAVNTINKMFNRFKVFLDVIWEFFSSIRLAIILILILVALSLIGTLVIQVPAQYAANPDIYNWWLQNVAQPQTGFWYPLLNFGELFNVFHSPWFLGTGILLIINIIVCTLNRWKRTRSAISQSRVKNSDEFYNSGNSVVDLSDIPTNYESFNLFAKILKKHRYTVRTETSSDTIYLAADKNRYSPLGTYFIHLSLILLIAGYLIGSSFGFRDTSFIVPVQSTRAIGYNTGLSIHLNSFVDEFWPDGSPKNYQSNVVVYDNGHEVKNGIIRVNHPLTYKGVNIYQSFFGPAARIQIKNTSGNVLFEGNIALSETILDQSNQRPMGELALSKQGYTVYITGRATNTDDATLKNGQVEMEVFTDNSTTPLISTIIDKGVPYKSNGLEVTYLGDSMFSGFEISHDPGTNLIWTASALFLLGLFAVFYFPRRRIWAFIRKDSDEGKRIRIRVDSGNKSGTTSELASMIRRLKHELGETGIGEAK